MRLLIVGTFGGRLTTAAQLARENGADVTHAESTADALKLLSSGVTADVLLIDAALGISDFVSRLQDNLARPPIIACGIDPAASIATATIQSGAKEYLPLPGGADEIAAVITAMASDNYQPLRQAKVASNPS